MLILLGSAILQIMFDNEKIKIIKKWLGAGSIDIFGRPFSGKDYQGRQLADIFNGITIGSGDILRSSRAEKQTRTGYLTPTEDFIDIVLPYFKQNCLHDKPLLLSSVGRWHGEEGAVAQALDESGHPLTAVIYLDLSNDESRSRWLARETNNDRVGRHDDTLEVLKTRFTEFNEKTIPVIEHYRNIGKLVEIDGKQSREKVTSDIIEALFERAKTAN